MFPNRFQLAGFDADEYTGNLLCSPLLPGSLSGMLVTGVLGKRAFSICRILSKIQLGGGQFGQCCYRATVIFPIAELRFRHLEWLEGDMLAVSCGAFQRICRGGHSIGTFIQYLYKNWLGHSDILPSGLWDYAGKWSVEP